MRLIFFALTIAFFTLSCGQNEIKQKELELKERELNLREKELILKENKSIHTETQNTDSKVQVTTTEYEQSNVTQNDLVQGQTNNSVNNCNTFIGTWVHDYTTLKIRKSGAVFLISHIIKVDEIMSEKNDYTGTCEGGYLDLSYGMKIVQENGKLIYNGELYKKIN